MVQKLIFTAWLRLTVTFLGLPVTFGLIQFLLEPSTLIVKPSDPIWWHCTARLVGTNTALSYIWSKGGQPISINSNIEVFKNGTLHIREVTTAEIGSYHCRAQGGGEIAYSQTASLSIAALDESFSHSPTSISITLGGALSLQCGIESNPPATITWQQNGSPIQENDVTIATQVIDMETQSSLYVTSVSHRHGGQYNCQATNSLLEGAIRYSGSATVTLIGRPGFATIPSAQVAIVGTTVTLQCTTTGTPSATVIWENDEGQAVQNSPKFIISDTGLGITNVQLTDAGYYTCKAVNDYGVNTAVALLSVTTSFTPVAFTRTPTSKTSEVGGRVTFACDASGTPTPTITWSKEDGTVPSDRTDEPAPGWLRINNIVPDDSGAYICTASNGLSSSSRNVLLTVQEPPYFITLPDDVIVMQGETGTLDCSAGGSPKPDISWRTPISSLGTLDTPSRPISTIKVADNGSLIISSAELVHAGVYTCRASNSISTVSTEARVTVHGPPLITLTLQDMIAIEGQTVTLTCRAGAVPWVLKFLWSFQSEQLITNLKYEVFGNGDLRINNIEKKQQGTYSCQAVNYVGTSGIEAAYVTVQVPPKVEVHPIDLTLDVGSNVSLFCEATGDPTPTLQWKTDEGELVLADNVMISTNFTLEITGMRKENEGNYFCIATNAAGSMQGSAVIMTPDIPEFITPSNNITSNQSQSAVIPCRATARETPRIYWYLTDEVGTQGEEIGLGDNVPGTRGFQSIVREDGALFLNAVSLDDEGWYLCTAVNSIASVEKLIYLYVNFPPSISTSYQATGEGLTARAILKCDVDGQLFPTASWYLPSGDPVEEVRDRYYINDVGSSNYLLQARGGFP